MYHDHKSKKHNYYVEAAKATHNKPKPRPQPKKKTYGYINGFVSMGYLSINIDTITTANEIKGASVYYMSFDGPKWAILGGNPAAEVYQDEVDTINFSIQSYRLPGITHMVETCPTGQGCGGNHPSATLHQMIMHLNDWHRWTRGQIADWLESIHDPTGVNGPNLNFGGRSE